MKDIYSSGLSNYDSEDLSGYMRNDKKTKMLKAYCSSVKCSKGLNGKKVYKPEVKRGQDDCPDCGEFLFWRFEFL